MNTPLDTPLITPHGRVIDEGLTTGDRLAKGELVRRVYGEVRSYRLRPNEWPIYEAAKRNGYLVAPRAALPRQRLRNCFWGWAEPRGLPVTIIDPRTKYACIEIDLIHLDRSARMSPVAVDLVRAILCEHQVGGLYAADDTYAFAGRIPLIVVEHVAQRMMAIAMADLGVAL